MYTVKNGKEREEKEGTIHREAVVGYHLAARWIRATRGKGWERVETGMERKSVSWFCIFHFRFPSDENALTGTRIERESCLHSTRTNGACRKQWTRNNNNNNTNGNLCTRLSKNVERGAKDIWLNFFIPLFNITPFAWCSIYCIVYWWLLMFSENRK